MHRSFSSLTEMEHTLQSRLGPVAPNPDFVSKLYNRLRTDPGIFVEQKSTPILILAIGAGLAAGIIYYLLFRRSRDSKEID